METKSGNTERTLLVVDDEENILKALIRLFRREGYRILRANSGGEGLEVLKKDEVGVIVSDQRMPDMMGVEFLSLVKELYPDTVRIVLSGYTDLESVTDAINKGAIYKFLTKPWEDELLRRHIREAFQHAELLRENKHLTQELQKTNAALYQLNQELECRVEDKTRQILLNMHSLRISQEILERLPAGIIGIDSNEVVVAANQAAHQILQMDTGSLTGLPSQSTLPEAVYACLEGNSSQSETAYQLLTLDNGATVQLWVNSLGETSDMRGKILLMCPLGGVQ